MKDFFGNELNEGDRVVFIEPSYRNFRRGTIVKLTSKRVRIKYAQRYFSRPTETETVREPHCVIKSPDQDHSDQKDS